MGLLRYQRLPFGLTNAPATFQRAIDIILSGLRWRTCLVYLDDIIVSSAIMEDHIRHLRDVLSLLFNAGVTLKPEKCHLFETKVDYLGHVLSPGELRVNKKNIRALRDASQPKIETALKSFLGMCNVYRRFVRNYALIARPLTKLTSKKLPAQLPVFDEKKAGAFEELKRRLTTTPVLALPKRDGQFVLETEACGTQVRCALLQQQPDGHFLPVGYYSRVLTPAEKNYSTTERECLAVVWACFLLRPYLEGQEFLIRTDHGSLRWLLSMDSSQGRLARWRLRLAEFKYKVCTRAGREHHCADIMSRLETQGVDDSVIPEEIPCFILPNVARGWHAPLYEKPDQNQPITIRRMLVAQLKDAHCLELRRQMDRNRKGRYSESADGLLIRVSPFDRAK